MTQSSTGAWFRAKDVYDSAMENMVRLASESDGAGDSDRCLKIAHMTLSAINLAKDENIKVFVSVDDFFALRRQWPPMKGSPE